jgi:hypothetical protein
MRVFFLYPVKNSKETKSSRGKSKKKVENKVGFIEIKSIEINSVTMTGKGLLGISTPPNPHK